MQKEYSFRELAQKIAREHNSLSLLPVIEKEILHYEILLAMDKARYLDSLVFQGGTCLRLCYSSQRYSEDLDFVGGTQFDIHTLYDLRAILTHALEKKYDVQVDVVEPNRSSEEDVYSWKIKVVTSPQRPDLPMQRISLEIAAIPAHTKIVRPLEVNYQELPQSYANTLVFCESPEEICADKLKAFITASNIRYRDLWDLRWLSRQPGFCEEKLAPLLQHKLHDYSAHIVFAQNLSRIDSLETIIDSKDFLDQMKRFLPATTLEETLDRPLFREHLANTIRSLYHAAQVL